MTAGCFPDRDRVLPSGTGPPCGNPIPVGHALDGAPPASVVTHTTSSLAFRLVRSGHRLVGDAPLARRCRPSFRVGERRLTLPVAPRSRPEIRLASRNQDRFRRPLVKENGFPGPERLSSTSVRQVDWSAAFAVAPVCGNPPPISRLCHRRSGFRRSFTLPALSRGGARPIVGPADSSSTGARGHAPLVDFCNRYDPRPQPRTAELRRTSPAVARWRSHSHGVGLSTATLSCGWRRLLRGAASRDFTGQGPCLGQLPRSSTPPTTIARGESFAPTRSTRTPPVAARCVLRLETSVPRHAPERAHHHELAQRDRRSGGAL